MSAHSSGAAELQPGPLGPRPSPLLHPKPPQEERDESVQLLSSPTPRLILRPFTLSRRMLYPTFS